MTKRGLFELAIKHLEAEIGGLKFVQLHRPDRPVEAKKNTENLIKALSEVVWLLRWEINYAKKDWVSHEKG